MRWFRVRRANLPAEERELFERAGTAVVAQVMTGGLPYGVVVTPPLHRLYNVEVRGRAAEWLTEQYDRAERKETWRWR